MPPLNTAPGPANTTAEGAAVVLDLWSDYVCPFCYLELPVLQQLKDRYGAALDIQWHPFELRPDPAPTLAPDGEYLHTIWNRAVYPMATARGMLLRLPPVQPRSRLAMEAAEFARDSGCFERMNTALFRAFFEDGLDLAEPEVLLQVGHGAGLAVDALRAALADGRYSARVTQARQQAERLGMSGVPFMLLRLAHEPMDAGQGLSGAQPFEAVDAAMQALLK